MSRERALEFLRARSVASLATQGPDGPWSAAVFFASRGFTLYFLSSPKTRHCGNLAREPRVAVTIQEDQPDWRKIKGVQLEGTARELSGEEEARARALFLEKFPLRDAPPEIAAALARVRWFEIAPRRVFFVDNAQGFGHRDELEP